MNTPEHSSKFQPLIDALGQMHRGVDSPESLPLIFTESSLEVFREQKLPTHCKVIPRPLVGPRVAVRGRRHHYEPQLHLARWPKARMTEGAVPSLACVLTGEADFQIADYTLCCKAGDCIVFPAGVPKQDGSQPHFVGDPQGRYGDVLWIYTGAHRNEGLSCWITRSEETVILKPPNAQCRVEHRFLAQLFNGFCTEAYAARRLPIMRRILALVLLLLLGEIEADNALEGWGKPRYVAPDGKSGPVSEALAYIEENLDQHLTITKVARQVILSPSTFTRLFKKETGQTFQEYQTQHRLEVAERLLATTNYPIIYICQRVGLKYGQLRALFHAAHGCSPGQWRMRKK